MSPAGARRVEAVILATIVLFGLLSVLSFRALLPLAAISTAALLWLLRDHGLFRAVARSPTYWALCGILVAGAASWFVSLDQAVTREKILQLAAIFTTGMLMIAAFRAGAAHVSPRRLRSACLAALGLMIGGLFIVSFFADPFIAAGVAPRYFSGPDHLQNRAAFLLAVWAFVCALIGGRWGWLSVCAALMTLIVIHDGAGGPLGPVIAMIFGLIAAGLAIILARRAILVLRVAAMTALIGMTPLFHLFGDDILSAAESQIASAPDSVVTTAIKSGNGVHRLEIWHSVADRAVERTGLGWGLDATRRVPANRETYADVARTTISLHPHNSFLQIWLEMGVIGVLAGLAVIAMITKSAHGVSADRGSAIAFSAAIASALLTFSVSFGVFQSWWITGLFLIVSFAVLIKQNAQKNQSSEN